MPKFKRTNTDLLRYAALTTGFLAGPLLAYQQRHALTDAGMVELLGLDTLQHRVAGVPGPR